MKVDMQDVIEQWRRVRAVNRQAPPLVPAAGDAGSCMNCHSVDDVYLLYLGQFEARLCWPCLQMLAGDIWRRSS